MYSESYITHWTGKLLEQTGKTLCDVSMKALNGKFEFSSTDEACHDQKVEGFQLLEPKYLEDILKLIYVYEYKK